MNEKPKKMPFRETRDLLLSRIKPVSAEIAPLDEVYGRILARDVIAGMMIPHYDRSPFDGYAFRSSDAKEASPETPVTLRVIAEFRAGDSAGDLCLGEGEAVRIMTGAPVPRGADAVTKYEDTVFTQDTVTLTSSFWPGQNVIRAGEDVKAGATLARKGDPADTAVMGMLASQGLTEALVYRRLRVAVIATGNELQDPGTLLSGGQIYNSNRYMLMSELQRAGYIADYAGNAGDAAAEIASLISGALQDHDAVITTGGVSAGDYDLVPDALRDLGAEILVHGVRMKPGMACVYAFLGEKPCIALSGNPAAALTNYHAIAAPLLRSYAGRNNAAPDLIRVRMLGDFAKGAKGERLLRGRMEIRDGRICMNPSPEQGNAVISSLAGADLMVIVPGDHGPVKAGDDLLGFMIQD